MKGRHFFAKSTTLFDFQGEPQSPMCLKRKVWQLQQMDTICSRLWLGELFARGALKKSVHCFETLREDCLEIMFLFFSHEMNIHTAVYIYIYYYHYCYYYYYYVKRIPV